MALWTSQWRRAGTPCSDIWPGCANAMAFPPPRPAQLGGREQLWNRDVCVNEPFECRLSAALSERGVEFKWLAYPRDGPRTRVFAAIVRMPEKDPKTNKYSPLLWHRPLGLAVGEAGRLRR